MSGRKQKEPLSYRQVAEMVKRRLFIARDQGGRLYHYFEGAYRRDGERAIGLEVRHVLDASGHSNEWQSRITDEAIKYLSLDAPELWAEPPVGTLNVKNGLLDLETRELKHHSRHFLSTFQIPVPFDPGSTCPLWEELVVKIFPPGAPNLPFELIAAIVSCSRDLQFAVLLMGEGGNGKSTFLNLLVAFLGRENVSTVGLQQLETERFHRAQLLGKVANISADISSARMPTSNVFKAITGGDRITAEFKHKPPFDFQPYSKLIFSANQPFATSDNSDGYFDRWRIIPFQLKLRGTDASIPGDLLSEVLTSDTEMSGVLNRVLDVYAEVMQRRDISRDTVMEAAAREFRGHADPIGRWLSIHCEIDDQSVTPKRDVYDAYLYECELRDHPVPTAQAFGRQLWRLIPTLAQIKRRFNGRVVDCYVGITLKKRRSGHGGGGVSDVSDDSHLSLDEKKKVGKEVGDIPCIDYSREEN